MPEPLLWLTERDIVELVDQSDAIDAIAAMLPQEAAGDAGNIAKALGSWQPQHSLHSLGSVAPADGIGGFKSWINVPAGASALFVLFDTSDGSVRAVMESGALGALRTSAISGVATDHLSRLDATSLAVIGSGRQALAQVMAVLAVRPITRLTVWSRDPDRALSLVAQVAALAPEVAGSVATEIPLAVQGADIITIVTRAAEPFFGMQGVSSDAHINAVGAILRANGELLPEVLVAADLVVVDNVANARSQSRELVEHFGDDPQAWNEVRTLGEIIASGKPRGGATGISVFKSMGMGLSDLAVARLVHARALERGVGLAMEGATPHSPRWGRRAVHNDAAPAMTRTSQQEA